MYFLSSFRRIYHNTKLDLIKYYLIPGMLTALLIGLACTQALFALAPPSAGEVECYANRRVYQAGESYSMGCETCTCGGDGWCLCFNDHTMYRSDHIKLSKHLVNLMQML